MKPGQVVAFVAALALIAGLAALAPGDTDPKYYFGAIGLFLVLGVIGLLGVFAHNAEESAQKLYFGVIGTLVGSVIGLTGGIAGGTVGANDAAETAVKDVAQDQMQVAEEAAKATVVEVRKDVKQDVTEAVKDAGG